MRVYSILALVLGLTVFGCKTNKEKSDGQVSYTTAPDNYRSETLTRGYLPKIAECAPTRSEGITIIKSNRSTYGKMFFEGTPQNDGNQLTTLVIRKKFKSGGYTNTLSTPTFSYAEIRRMLAGEWLQRAFLKNISLTEKLTRDSREYTLSFAHKSENATYVNFNMKCQVPLNVNGNNVNSNTQNNFQYNNQGSNYCSSTLVNFAVEYQNSGTSGPYPKITATFKNKLGQVEQTNYMQIGNNSVSFRKIGYYDIALDPGPEFRGCMTRAPRSIEIGRDNNGRCTGPTNVYIVIKCL